MNIGNRLANQRKKFRYTQSQLSNELKMSQQVISNYERNVTTPPIQFLQSLADLYMISIDELIGRKDSFDSKNNLDIQIMDILEKLDEREKELSLGLISTLAKFRGKNDDE